MRARRNQARIIDAERLIHALVWPVILTLLFVAAALFRLPQSLPDILRAALSIAWIATVTALILRGITRLRGPTPALVDRRLEKGSALHPHALTLLTDRPSDPRQQPIWDAHIDRTLRKYARLRPSLPRIDLSRTAGVLLVCGSLLAVTGAYNAGDHAASRMIAGLIPGTDDADVRRPDIQAWITPPLYAPAPPIYLDSSGDAVTVAPGAKLEAHVMDAGAMPWVTGAFTHASVTRRAGPRSWRVQTRLLKGGEFVMRARGRIIARWTVHLLPDPPPTISWVGKPKILPETTSIKANFKASQPFGIASVTLTITPDRPSESLKGATYSRTYEKRNPRVEGQFQKDIAQLPFAGDAATLRFTALSRSGQKSVSAPQHMVLPAHKFFDPVSRALIDLRQRLLQNEEKFVTADRELEALVSIGVTQDRGIALQAENAIRQRPRNSASYADILWAMAIYRDDVTRHGRAIADANLALQASQNALRAFLASHLDDPPNSGRSVNPDTLHTRVNAVRRAIDARMRILMFHALLQSGIIPDPGAVVPGRNDAVTQLLNHVEEQAGNGAIGKALGQLEKLSTMAHQLRDATPQELAQAARQQAQDLRDSFHIQVVRDLIRRHTQLLDLTQARRDASAQQTEEERRNGFRTDPSHDLEAVILGVPDAALSPRQTPDTRAGAEERARFQDARRDAYQTQGALRDALKALIDDIESREESKVPDGLGKAERDMGHVRQSLARRDDGGAAKALKDVIDDLAQSGRDMKAEREKRQHGDGPMVLLPTMQPGQGTSGSGKKGSGRGEESDSDQNDGDAIHKTGDSGDPLGRRVNDGQGRGKGGQSGMIDHTDQRRLDIERELRRRATDRTRPPREQKYLQDLLKALRSGASD